MILKEFMRKHKEKILRQWLDLVYDTYPTETSRFLKEEQDRFANPVAYTMACNLDALLEDLLNNCPVEALHPHLEEIIKIRAVQDFSPSRAVSFVPLAKIAILNSVPDKSLTREMYAAIHKMDGQIDMMTGAAFDIYCSCKDAINQLRIKDLKAENRVLSRMLGKSEGGH
jgi:hypothetical protein